MTGRETYFLEASSDGNKLSICLYESAASLRPKIDVDVNLESVKKLTLEIISLIHRSHVSSSSSTQFQEDLRKHCMCLFDDLLPDHHRAKIKSILSGNIIFLIDEPLVFIPWELLHDGNDYLSLKFSVGRIVRTSRQVREVSRRSVGVPPKMLVLADPCGDLLGAQKEARVIRNQLDKNGHVVVTTRTAEITLDYVKKHIRDYDVLHYAGHADHGQSHDISGLRLSDGCLSVTDIIKLGVTAPLPALIFCNACQSAHDNSDDMSRGVFGIANAFLTSGVRHYVGCLWKIPDRESVTAAGSFYHSVFSGVTVGEALRLTRIELIQQYGWSSLVWASYILYGDPSVIFGVSLKSNTAPASKRSRRKVIISFILAALLSAGIGASIFYYLNFQPEPPGIIIEEFIVPATQSKDTSLTFEVMNELKKISSANLLSKQQSSGVIKTRVRRTVRVEVDKTDGLIHLIIKVLDPESNKIISLKEFVVEDTNNTAREIAERVLDLIKVGLSKAEEVELTRRPNENPEVHRLLSKSWDLFLNGDLKGALQLCEKIKKIDSSNPDLYKRLGNIYDDLGRKEEALDAYYKYAALCKKSNDLKSLSNAYTNIGWIFQNMNDDELAYKHFDKALQIAQLGEYSYQTAKAFESLGSWHLKKKDFVKAKELLQQAVHINQSNLPDYKHNYSLATNYSQLGEVYDIEGDYSESLKYLNMSLDIFKEIAPKPIKPIAAVKKRIESVFGKQIGTDNF